MIIKYKWQFYTAEETSIKWLDIIDIDFDELLKKEEANWFASAITFSLIIWFFVGLFAILS